MYVILSRLFNIKREEAGLSLLYALSALLIGFFISGFDILAHVIFFHSNTTYSFPIIYISAGVFGLGIFIIYSIALRKLTTRFFVLVNFIATLVILVIVYVGVLIQTMPYSNYLPIVVMFPVNILFVMAFWRYGRSLFHAEQTKQVFPLAELFFYLGIIIGGVSYLTGLLDRGLHFNVQVLVITIFLVIILFFIKRKVHANNLVFNQHEEVFVPVKSVFIFFRSKFTIYLFIFGVISSLIAFLLHFQFMSEANSSFPYIGSLSKFYGLYFIITAIGFLVFDRLIIHKILYSYDSPYSLVLIPVLLGIMVVLYFSIEYGVGYASIEELTLSFILLIFIKVVYETSKNSMQVPSLRCLFNSLDIRYQQIIFSRVEGVLVMLGMIISGGIVYFYYRYMEPYTSYTLIGIFVLSLVWIVISVKLIKLYRKALENNIRKIKFSPSQKAHLDSFDEQIRNVINTNDPNKLLVAMEVLAKVQPLLYEKMLVRLLPLDKRLRKYAVERIQELKLWSYLPQLKQSYEHYGEEDIKEVIIGFEQCLDIIKQYDDIDRVLRSDDLANKLCIASYVSSCDNTDVNRYLNTLARDFEPQLQESALRSIARLSDNEHVQLLMEHLLSDEYAAYAFDALVNIGDSALDALERLFAAPDIDEIYLTRVVRVYGKIGSAKAIEYLLKKLDSPNMLVVQQAIFALKESKFQATANKVKRMTVIILKVITSLVQNLYTLDTLKGKKQYRRLYEAMEKEVALNYQHLFDLLSMTYNHNAIQSVYRLFQHGNRSEISHAIELIDEMIEEEIKVVLFPLLEDISNKERIKKLQYYFPNDRQNYEDLLISIITRDYNQLSLYPRAIAMLMLAQKKNKTVPQELIFSLYHPNKLIFETAAYVTEVMEPGYLLSIRNRIEPDLHEQLQQTNKNIWDENSSLLVENVEFLDQVVLLNTLTEDVLIKFAIALKWFTFKKGEKLLLTLRRKEFSLFFVKEGALKNKKGLKVNLVKGRKYQLFNAEILFATGNDEFVFSSDSVVGAINKSALDNCLFDHIDVAKNILKTIE
ncbi:MAG: hypothetical protein MI922_17310 [Bacteroidales bacterium]|nr:hypothetical protein [Bacteroidales bacterium]